MLCWPEGRASPKSYLAGAQVFAAYSKDTFVHSKLCPWVQDMDLNPGEAVMFNLVRAANGKHIRVTVTILSNMSVLI